MPTDAVSAAQDIPVGDTETPTSAGWRWIDRGAFLKPQWSLDLGWDMRISVFEPGAEHAVAYGDDYTIVVSSHWGVVARGEAAADGGLRRAQRAAVALARSVFGDLLAALDAAEVPR